MSRKNRYKGLIGLNAALIVALTAVSFAPGASAQDGDSRARGAYAMVAGQVQGTVADAIYVVDRVNQEVVAMTFEQGRKRLVGIDFAKMDQTAGGAR